MQLFEIGLFALVCLSGAIILFCRYVKPELAKRSPEPVALDYARSFFPVLLLVFLLRGFVAEPFNIPSGSMLPTLEDGDYILVNKFSYGVRLPILRTKIMDTWEPKRGDVVVFRYPVNPDQNYIKRLIGLPGDVIEYRNKELFVNGEKMPLAQIEDYLEFNRQEPQSRFVQEVTVDDEADAEKVAFPILHFKGRYPRGPEGRWVVPEDQYFMMGDNRDNSKDSRAWLFVPDENIVGKAFFIWMHYNRKGGGFDFGRIGNNIKAKLVSAGGNQ